MILRLLYCCFLFLLTLPSTLVNAQTKTEIRGTIKKLDLENGTLAFKPLYSDKILALSLAGKEVPVTNIVGQRLPLTDLQEGQRAFITVVERTEIVAVQLEWPTYWGALQKVEFETGKLYLQNNLRDLVLPLSRDVPLVIDGKPGRWNELKDGQALKATVSVDGKKLLQVHAGKDIFPRDPHRQLRYLNGVILDVDPGPKKLQILIHNTSEPLSLEWVPVHPEAPIKINYHKRWIMNGSFEDFHKLVSIHFVRDEETQTIELVEAEVPEKTFRKVLRFEAGKTVVYEEQREEKSLPLSADFKVFLAGKGEGKVSDIDLERRLNLGLSLDRSRVITIFVPER